MRVVVLVVSFLQPVCYVLYWGPLTISFFSFMISIFMGHMVRKNHNQIKLLEYDKYIYKEISIITNSQELKKIPSK